jgi:hypothetical protein
MTHKVSGMTQLRPSNLLALLVYHETIWKFCFLYLTMEPEKFVWHHFFSSVRNGDFFVPTLTRMFWIGPVYLEKAPTLLVQTLSSSSDNHYTQGNLLVFNSTQEERRTNKSFNSSSRLSISIKSSATDRIEGRFLCAQHRYFMYLFITRDHDKWQGHNRERNKQLCSTQYAIHICSFQKRIVFSPYFFASTHVEMFSFS